MNCQHVQQRLLATSGRRTPTPDVLAHLETCPACRTWSERLNEIDATVSRLPVPDSSAAKASLANRFLSPPAPSAPPIWKRVKLSWPKAIAAAAAVILLALAVSGVFNREPSRPAAAAPDELLAQVMKRHLELATADSLGKRVEVLAGLADDLDGQTRSLARVAQAEDLNTLADLYVSVVEGDRGLIKQTENLPAADQKKLLPPIAEKLRRTNELAASLSREGVPPAAAQPLKKIADAARQGHLDLQKRIIEARAGIDKSRDHNVVQEAPPPIGEGKS